MLTDELLCVTGKRSELLSGNTVVLKEKIDDTNQIFQNGKWFYFHLYLLVLDRFYCLGHCYCN